MAAAALVLSPTTPPDYHRIVSPTLRIPSDPSITIPVGLLTCQRDPLLRNLDTTIISARYLKPATQPGSGGGKKAHTKQAKASAAPTLTQPYLQVILHDTVLFPEGGGQPYDIGLLTTDDGEVWDVELVKRHGGVAAHYLRVKHGVEDVPVAFTPGKKVSLALGEAGFQRRLDHRSLIPTRLQVPTLAWSLTSYPSPSYVDLARALTPDEVSLIQDEANRLVFEGRRVHIEVDELHAGEKGIDTGDASSRELGRGLPSDYTGGVHRVVVIDGVDRNPCCGTHLPSLASLQLYILPPPPSTSTAPVRHYFLAGPRLLTHLGTVQTLLTRTAGVLSCGAAETPERVALVVDESKRREKRVDEVEKQLAEELGRRLAVEMAVWRAGGGEGEWVKYVGRTDDTPTALPFLQTIAVAFAAALPDASQGTYRYTLLLSSSPSSQTPSSTSVVVLFGSDDDRVKAVGEDLKKHFKTLKGGGRGIRWSGKYTGVWLPEREGKLASQILEGAMSS
ncbi:ThrRS/AlaRS common domain-containing protein [Artomyces pyxidatus]|uniref:ThrRS/AlaRS common domain-containing protein n=1 Tax=Artomyces pyxidatus TaxID=48021 RepID=A0ACB8TJW6_9AGAM|nr:ThrRS/AlaRS common domain-containing protein [Artomyces pyxidatus]